MKAKFALAAALLLLVFAACSPQTEVQEPSTEKESVTFPVTDASEYWSVTINDVKFAGDLTGTLDSVQYDGEVIQTSVDVQPSDGNIFVLLDITVVKTKGGKSVFSWRDTSLIDADGNSYPRHENDTFLDTMGFSRIKASDLTLGTSTGWACYEVPEGDNPLTFSAAVDGSEIKIQVN